MHGEEMPSGRGLLVLAGTPIGDAGDVSPRVLEWLARADVVAAEDTRKLRRLAAASGLTVTAPVVTHHEHNEVASTSELVRMMAGQARTVVLVSDAGMPTVSDPGYRLVRAAIEAGVRVIAAPGPSAVTTALAVSGLPSDRFCFEGFLPRREGERARVLAGLASEARTLVFFEAPHRLDAALWAMLEAFGPGRHAVICRELTKTHEQVLRGKLVDLWQWTQDHQVLGEITVVVAGAAPSPPTLSELTASVADRTREGHRLKDAVKEVAKLAGVSTRELYEECLQARR